jgi:hypothetical protein
LLLSEKDEILLGARCCNRAQVKGEHAIALLPQAHLVDCRSASAATVQEIGPKAHHYNESPTSKP